MADHSVVVVDFWASPFGNRVRIAPAEKGVEFDYREENILESKKNPLLLQSNPVHKKVPVLIHNGSPICESLLILQYIYQVWADKSPLMPKDPYERANARFWAGYIDNKVYPSGSGITRNKGEDQEGAKKEFIQCLKVLEGELENKPYFGGDTFGFLDIALIPFSCWFHLYKSAWYFDVEEECPKLMQWAGRCMERDSVSKHLPDPQKLFQLFQSVRKMLESV